MRSSLAIKIFLSFWLIHALIFLVLAVAPDQGRGAGRIDRLRDDARAAAGLFESHGREACDQFLGVRAPQSAGPIGLYDSRGRQLCGRAPGGDESALGHELLAVGEAGAVVRVDGRDLAVVAVTTPGGVRYHAAGATRPGGPGARPERPIPYGLLVTAAMVSGVVCFVLARVLAAPLQRMGRAAHRLKEGDLTARAGAVVAASNDEIGDVVRDFDAMAERIEFLVGAQRQLLSDISHELRSPLARLNVALELARRSSGEAARGHLDRIETEAARMNELVGQLLAWARAGSAGSGSPTQAFDLGEVVERVAEDADYEARTSGKRVSFSRRGDAIVHGDPAALASALENVARNAVRHTGAATTVEIEQWVEAAQARVAIRDHGPGVPAAELTSIFLPFRRIDASRDRESGGSGLGLSIAQRAVAAHGGTIAAENAEGGGLTVTISLPVRPSAD